MSQHVNNSRKYQSLTRLSLTSQRSRSMTIRMALERSAVVMAGLSGTIISIRNVVGIVPFSQMMKATILKKNTTTSIGEIIEQSRVVKKTLLVPAGDSVRQRKHSGMIRRRGKLRMPKVPPKRRFARKYSTSSMNSLTSRGRPRSQESHVMTQ